MSRSVDTSHDPRSFLVAGFVWIQLLYPSVYDLLLPTRDPRFSASELVHLSGLMASKLDVGSEIAARLIR